jgi:hypothetical protein
VAALHRKTKVGDASIAGEGVTSLAARGAIPGGVRTWPAGSALALFRAFPLAVSLRPGSWPHCGTELWDRRSLRTKLLKGLASPRGIEPLFPL